MDEAERVPDEIVYVSALTCREVLIEKDGTPTAFRFADRIHGIPYFATSNPATAEADPTQQPVAIFRPAQISAVISFHAKASCEFILTVRSTRPDGSQTAMSEPKHMSIPAPGTGYLLNTLIDVATHQAGVHWIEIWVSGVLRNQMPITITHPLGLENHRKWTQSQWTEHVESLGLQSQYEKI